MKEQCRALTVALVALAACAGAGAQAAIRPATQPATQPSELGPVPQAVAQLLAGMDSPQFADREAAEAELLEAVRRDPALSAFIEHAVRAHASPEVRARAADVLDQHAQFVMFGETRITLHLQRVHPRRVYQAIAEQAGMTFEYWPQEPWGVSNLLDRVSLDLDAVPFWQALGAAGRATGVNPVEHQVPAPGGMVLSEHGEALGDAPIAHSGAFAVQLRRLYSSENVVVQPAVGPDGQVAGNADVNRSLHVELRLLVEPKVRLSGGMSIPTIDVALDEHGNSLIEGGIGEHVRDQRRGGGGWYGQNGQWSFVANVPLDPRRARASRTLARLRGQFEATVALETTRLEVPLADLADVSRLKVDAPQIVGKTFRAGPHEVRIVSLARRPDGQLQVEVSMPVAQQDMNDPDGWQQRQALLSAMRLLDASGRPWRDNGGGGPDWDGQTLKLNRLYAPPSAPAATGIVGEGAKIVWELPVRSATITVPFEFHNIPLPRASD